MPTTTIELLDPVELIADLPAHNLKRGAIGTVVEILAPDAFEVEFCNEDGETLVEVALLRAQVMLHEAKPR